jgi:hypothetical protein
MKKIIYIGALLASAGVLGLGVLAYAQSAPGMSGPNASGISGMQEPQGGGNNSGASGRRQAPPIVITVDVNGHALIRGTLVSSAGTTLTVKSWGMQFTVDASNARIVGNATSVSLFAAGDIIGVQGVMDENNPGTVTAATVRDWGTTQNVGAANGLNGASSSNPRIPDNPGLNQQGGGKNPGGFGMFGMPPGSSTSGTPELQGPGMLGMIHPSSNASGTPGMPSLNASGTPGMQGGQGSQGAQGLQQRLQSLLDQLSKLRAQLPAQQGQSGQ